MKYSNKVTIYSKNERDNLVLKQIQQKYFAKDNGQLSVNFNEYLIEDNKLANLTIRFYSVGLLSNEFIENLSSENTKFKIKHYYNNRIKSNKLGQFEWSGGLTVCEDGKLVHRDFIENVTYYDLMTFQDQVSRF